MSPTKISARPESSGADEMQAAVTAAEAARDKAVDEYRKAQAARLALVADMENGAGWGQGGAGDEKRRALTAAAVAEDKARMRMAATQGAVGTAKDNIVRKAEADRIAAGQAAVRQVQESDAARRPELEREAEEARAALVAAQAEEKALEAELAGMVAAQARASVQDAAEAVRLAHRAVELPALVQIAKGARLRAEVAHHTARAVLIESELPALEDAYHRTKAELDKAQEAHNNAAWRNSSAHAEAREARQAQSKAERTLSAVAAPGRMMVAPVVRSRIHAVEVDV